MTVDDEDVTLVPFSECGLLSMAVSSALNSRAVMSPFEYSDSASSMPSTNARNPVSSVRL